MTPQERLKAVVEKFNNNTRELERKYRLGAITYEQMLQGQLNVLKDCQSEAWIDVVNLS